MGFSPSGKKGVSTPIVFFNPPTHTRPLRCSPDLRLDTSFIQRQDLDRPVLSTCTHFPESRNREVRFKPSCLLQLLYTDPFFAGTVPGGPYHPCLPRSPCSAG